MTSDLGKTGLFHRGVLRDCNTRSIAQLKPKPAPPSLGLDEASSIESAQISCLSPYLVAGCHNTVRQSDGAGASVTLQGKAERLFRGNVSICRLALQEKPDKHSPPTQECSCSIKSLGGASSSFPPRSATEIWSPTCELLCDKKSLLLRSGFLHI